jgi:hypothetical protein
MFDAYRHPVRQERDIAVRGGVLVMASIIPERAEPDRGRPGAADAMATIGFSGRRGV